MKPKQSFSNRGGSSAKRQRHAQSRRLRPLRTLHFTVGLFAALAPFAADRATAATLTWIGGNVDWVDATGTANWSPADEPDPDDAVIFNTANTVNLGSNNAILSLALSGGISLNTTNFDLTVDGLLQLTGSGTDITIGDSTSAVQADQVTINSGGTISLADGALNVIEETASGLLSINAGGTLSGHGTVNLQDGVASATTLMINSGTLSAWSFNPIIGAPAVGTLQVNASDPTDARLDLDAFAPVTAVVNVFHNQTLDINVTLFDAYSGDLNLFHNSTLDMSAPWSIDAGATVDVDNGNTGGFLPTSANTSFIAGAAFTQSGGTITVVDTDGTLQFNAPFTHSAGNLVNNGKVVFNANATIGPGANFTMPTDYSSLTLNSGVTVTVTQADFNADGAGTAANQITINSGSRLNLDVGAGADEALSGPVILNGGILDMTTLSNTWAINSALAIGASTGTSNVNGEPVNFRGATTIGTNAVLRVNAIGTLHATASFAVAAGATLGFPTAPIFNGASFTGDGVIRVEGSSQVAATTAIGVNQFDWDWNATGETHTINTGVTFTINSPLFDYDGDMDDGITLQGTGSTLNVNGPTEWTMNGALNSNPAAATAAAVGGTSRVIFADALRANSGTTSINAPATLGATAAATVAAGAVLNFSDPVTFAGGVVTGNGTLRINSTSQVDSYTTIAVQTVDWDGTAMGSMHTISDGATLDISCTNFDSDGDMDDPLTIRGNGATLSVSGLVSWEMLGTLTTNPAQAGTAFLAGTAGISASGNFNANGNTTANARITFGPASLTTVAAGATLDLNAVPTFSGGEITGAGRLRIGGAPTVTANTTISAGSLDWDRDNTTHTHTINQGVTLTITSPVIENGGMRDALRVFGNNGTLTVSGPTSWDMRNTLTTNPTAVGTTYLNGTSDLVLTSATGIFNAAGNTTANASITFGPSSVTTVAAGATLDLYGAPTFSGGGITGAGTLRVGGSPVVTASTVISVATLDWDRDVFTHTHTINEGATLTITSPVIQGGGMRDSLTLRGNGSALTVSGPASWEMRGTLTTNLVALGTATVGGTSDLVLTSATGIFNARGNTTVATPITFGPSSATAVSAGATLTLNASATFAGPATVSGAGTLYIDKASTVTANTTIAVNTLNWDGGLVGSLHTINDGVALTINSPVLADEMSDDITLRGSGAVLAVNFSSPWEMRGTLTTNPANVGIATLAGSSRMVLNTATGLFNANGNTTVSAPITFGTGSITTVAAGARLTVSGDAIYNGGTITGAGDYWPPTGDHNTVTANSTISTTNFNFDSDDGLGAWTVAPGVRLTVNVVDYDGEVVNDFDSTLTLNSGNISANTADPVFVMEGTLNMNNTTGTIPYWSGDAIQIGDDAGTLDADINVGGTGISQIGTAIDFKSDADVDIAAGATLQLLGNASFNSVNGANNAEFTGGGRLQTNREVNFNEATTINMVGGALDLDGADGFGDTIFVKAPVIINVATMDSFGRVNGGGGTNTLDVNHSTATGTLAVNLDSPTAEWTLNAPGAMLLTNDPAAAAVTLLAGSAVNLNGLVNVTGDVRTTARVDIGGTVNILTAGKPLRLSGGDLTDTNTLVGGSINGPGLLGADSGSGLIGYGTINPDIDFDGSADLFADNGTLTVNGGILDARFFGTNDTDGILDVVHTWNSNTVTGVYLKGGELKGGTLFNDGAGGISGSGLVTARVINNSLINANNSAAPLILQATADYNDWDGYLAPETGRLQANAGTLELRSIGSFPFNSTVTAVNGGTVFANGFELLMRDGSTLNLTTGTFKQSNGITTNLYGTITVGAGTSQLLGAVTGGFRFNASCTTTLTGNLLLDCPTTFVAAGATFSGAGHLVNLSGKRLAPADAANLNVLVENAGTLAPGGTGVARNDFRDFIQGASGVLELNLNGTTLGAFDRLQINGSAQLTGTLQLSLGGGYVPALNDTITLLSTTGVVAGLFSPLVQPAGMPAGLAFEVNYLPNSVQLKVVSATPFDAWIKTFGIANPADRTKSANPDGDSLNNLGEFATDGNPTSGLSSGKIVGKIAPVGGVNAMTLTLPVRNGTVLDPADPAGGEFGLKQTADGLFYKIQASDGLGAWTLAVTEVNGPDATAIQLGLPALNPGWTYRTFRSPGPVAGDPVEFMRAVISD